MKRWLVIFAGFLLAAAGTLALLKDTFGENIEATAEAIAVNIVATKINTSLQQGFMTKAWENPF